MIMLCVESKINALEKPYQNRAKIPHYSYMLSILNIQTSLYKQLCNAIGSH